MSFRSIASMMLGAACAMPLLIGGTKAQAGEAVDVALVLAADVSRSINSSEFDLQRQGYAQAISSPDVIKAITGGNQRAITLTFVEWAGPGEEAVVVDWTIIHDTDSAKSFSAKMLAAPRSFEGRTAIGSAIDFAAGRLAASGVNADRQLIDVSGDGTNNAGRPVTMSRDAAVENGITINGLAIINPTVLYSFNAEHTNPPGGLPNYYKQNVIGGDGAFLLVVEDFESFGEAMTHKLLNEISALPDPHKFAGNFPTSPLS